jgi:multiple antibiotic resistance protein
VLISPEDLQAALKALIALLVVIDPLGMVPLYLAYARDFSAKERASIALTAFVAASGVLLGAQFLGDQMLKFFGIGIPSFRVAGGILILLMSLDMMAARPSRAKTTPEEEEERIGKHELAIVPVAIPLIAGPGAISAVILMASRDDNPVKQGGLSVLILAAVAVCYFTLLLSAPLEKWLGRTGINVMSRLMGLISASVAVEFIAAGLKGLFPNLAS